MSPSRPLLGALLTILSAAAVSSAADKDALGDPLPEGAKMRYGTTRFRVTTPNDQTVIAVSEDSYIIAALSGGESITLWDGKTGLPIREAVDAKLLLGRAYRLSFAKNHDLLGVWAYQGVMAIDSKTGNIAFQKKVAGLLPYLPGQKPRNQGGQLSANGKWLVTTSGGRATGTADVRVEIWDLVEQKSLATFKPLQNQSVEVTLSQDGKTLATWANPATWVIYLPSPSDPTPVPEKGPNPLEVIQIWNVDKKGEQKLIEVKNGIRCAALSPDGKVLAVAVASSGTNGISDWIELYDAVSGTRLEQFARRISSFGAVGFSPDGKRVYGLSIEGTAEFWDIASRKMVHRVESPIQAISGVVFPTNDKPIAWGVQGQAIVMWEIPSGKCLTPSTDLHSDAITSIAFLKDGQSLVSAGEDARWVEWDRARGTVIRSAAVHFPAGVIGPIAVSPDGSYVVGWPGQGVYPQNASIFVFDRNSGKELQATQTSSSPIYRSASKPIFSSDGSRFICTPLTLWPNNLIEDQRVRVWEIKSDSKAAEISLRAGDSTAAFTPDGSRLVSATITNGGPCNPPSFSLVINGWETKTGKKLGEIQVANWTKDPRYGMGKLHIAAVNNSSAIVASNTRLWGVDFEAGRDGEEFDSFPNNPMRPQPITVAVSKDGKLIAAGIPLEEGKYGVRIYDAVKGTKLHTFTGHTAPVTALTFSPDEKTLASGSQDTTILTWDLTVLRE